MGKKEYMEILLSQIRNEKAKEFVGEEIGAHIDDQTDTYMEFGLDQDTAEKKAVRSMGDPVETGASLDRIHKPKMSWSMIALVAILSVFGLVLQFLIGREADNMYYFQNHVVFVILGLIAMMLICFIDYSRLVMRGREIALVYLIFCLISMIFGRHYNGANMYMHFGPVTFSLHFIMYLSLPIFACLLYLYRNKGKRQLLIPIGFIAILLLGCAARGCSIILVGNIWLVAGVILTYAFLKGWYPVKIKSTISIMWAILLGVPAIMLGTMLSRANLYSYVSHRLDYFFTGEGAYAVMYGQFLPIREVLGNTYFFGGMASGGQSLTAENSIACDYILLHAASYYGMFVLIAVVALLAIFCGKVFHTSFKQKNQVGTIIGISCGMIFLVQIAEYVLMNLGLIPGTTVFLPLISYGGTGTVVSFILLGLLLSIYRYQNLVTEKKMKHKRLVIKVIDA